MIMISLTCTDRVGLHRHAHRLLGECLKLRKIEYSEDTPVIKGRMGKPSLAEHPDVHYNLSHAEGITACIVSDYECGIDCEKVRKYRPNVMKRAFSASERKMVESAPEAEKDLIFFRLWTLKESYVKAIGSGISYPMDTVEFRFEGDRIITDLPGCRFRQFIIKGGSFVAAVCELMPSPRGNKIQDSKSY